MRTTWFLTYVDGATVVPLGEVGADWLTGFSQRHFDRGAEYVPGIPQSRLVIAPGRYYIIDTKEYTA